MQSPGQKRPDQSRRNFVRRMFKQSALFAIELIKERYPDYDHDQLIRDITRKTKKKKKKVKSPLVRYGRYREIERLTSEYNRTGDPQLIIRANKLRKIISQPYRVKIKIGKDTKEYFFRATIGFKNIQELVNAGSTCKSIEEFEDLQKEKFKYIHLS